MKQRQWVVFLNNQKHWSVLPGCTLRLVELETVAKQRPDGTRDETDNYFVINETLQIVNLEKLLGLTSIIEEPRKPRPRRRKKK